MQNNKVSSLEIFCTIKSEPNPGTSHTKFQIQSQQCKKVEPTYFVETIKVLNDFKKEVEDVENIKTEMLHGECGVPSFKNEDELEWIQQPSYINVTPKKAMKNNHIKELNDVKKVVEDVKIIKTEMLHEEYDLPSIKSEDELNWTQQLSCNDMKPKHSKKAVDRKNCKIRKYSCLVCRKGLTKTTTRKNHLNVHFNKKLGMCFFCGCYFRDKILFLSHWFQHFVKKRTKKKPFKCKICLKHLPQKSALMDHIRTHACEKPFKCKFCLKIFSLKATLITHMRIHTGEKPFQCDICKKQFSQKVNLITHTRIHTGEKPFKCDICNKQFSQKVHLITLTRIHTGKKLVQCDICSKTFSRKTDLISHGCIHTSKRLIQCEICPKNFRRKQSLIIHMRIHTSEKPFKCDICSKNFSAKSTLMTHTRFHTGEKLVQCIRNNFHLKVV